MTIILGRDWAVLALFETGGGFEEELLDPREDSDWLREEIWEKKEFPIEISS